MIISHAKINKLMRCDVSDAQFIFQFDLFEKKIFHICVVTLFVDERTRSPMQKRPVPIKSHQCVRVYVLMLFHRSHSSVVSSATYYRAKRRNKSKLCEGRLRVEISHQKPSFSNFPFLSHSLSTYTFFFNIRHTFSDEFACADNVDAEERGDTITTYRTTYGTEKW